MYIAVNFWHYVKKYSAMFINLQCVYMNGVSMRGRERIYHLLAVKKKAVTLQKLSEELDTPMPYLFRTVKRLESDGLVEVFYGKEKAHIMVKARTIDDYM